MFVVFDLDGTLADNRHRLHYIARWPADYDSYYAACMGDAPIPIMLRALTAHLEAGDVVEIWTGRREDVRVGTMEWLGRHTSYVPPIIMRPCADIRSALVLKREWYQEHKARLGPIDLAYDDDMRIIDMWRAEGVSCLQVHAP